MWFLRPKQSYIDSQHPNEWTPLRILHSSPKLWSWFWEASQNQLQVCQPGWAQMPPLQFHVCTAAMHTVEHVAPLHLPTGVWKTSSYKLQGRMAKICRRMIAVQPNSETGLDWPESIFRTDILWIMLGWSKQSECFFKDAFSIIFYTVFLAEGLTSLSLQPENLPKLH